MLIFVSFTKWQIAHPVELQLSELIWAAVSATHDSGFNYPPGRSESNRLTLKLWTNAIT
jgi:hypothetical protein